MPTRAQVHRLLDAGHSYETAVSWSCRPSAPTGRRKACSPSRRSARTRSARSASSATRCSPNARRGRRWSAPATTRPSTCGRAASSPLEVEGALDEHPAVELAGVVGIEDEVHGENVRAYVVPRADAEARPSSAELIVFCRERVGYKAPEEIVFLEQMPLNPTGKIDRVGLKRMAEEHLHPHGLG